MYLKIGLPGRPVYSHAIMSPAKFDSYGSGYFPGIGDLLYDFDTLTEDEKKVRVVTLKKIEKVYLLFVGKNNSSLIQGCVDISGT